MGTLIVVALSKNIQLVDILPNYSQLYYPQLVDPLYRDLSTNTVPTPYKYSNMFIRTTYFIAEHAHHLDHPRSGPGPLGQGDLGMHHKNDAI